LFYDTHGTAIAYTRYSIYAVARKNYNSSVLSVGKDDEFMSSVCVVLLLPLTEPVAVG